MSAIVFASTGGRKYHFDQQCKAFHNAQDLNDWDCCCGDYCNHRGPVLHSLIRMSSVKAALDGKLPCLACVPTRLRTMPPLHGRTFGHMARTWGGRSVCARCVTGPEITSDDIDGAPDAPIAPDRSVAWPCTSAIVLGLEPRAQENAPRDGVA